LQQSSWLSCHTKLAGALPYYSFPESFRTKGITTEGIRIIKGITAVLHQIRNHLMITREVTINKLLLLTIIRTKTLVETKNQIKAPMKNLKVKKPRNKKKRSKMMT
jgi:hypothetical protein